MLLSKLERNRGAERLDTMAKAHPSPARLEAFSDGVIAVIITIMVLELKVPLESGLAGFTSVFPTLGVYALSFSFTGVYWVNHHHLVHRTDEADERILYANLFFLFWLSLLPFFTNYVLDKKMDSFSVGLYVVSMILTGGQLPAAASCDREASARDGTAGAGGRGGRAQALDLAGGVPRGRRSELRASEDLAGHRRVDHGAVDRADGQGRCDRALRGCARVAAGRHGRR